MMYPMNEQNHLNCHRCYNKYRTHSSNPVKNYDRCYNSVIYISPESSNQSGCVLCPTGRVH